MVNVMKRVLLTGASSDIGLATCQKYQEAGWFVVGHYRNDRAELDQVRGSQFENWQCDFANLISLESNIEKDKSKFSDLDAFVSLAADLPRIEFSNASSSDCS